MRKSLRAIGIIALIILSAACFLYLNYCPDVGDLELSFGNSELTDVKISKFIVETLKKVVVTVH
ncbi:MAG: hypothetical protein OEQ53_09600 [Saprospiraceae bacterium]|nr:hypothetical protein [Saprospiraceae bacterium]